ELVLDGQAIAIHKIHTASFQSGNETFYAFNFPQNGKDEFFDEKGLSMQRGGFLKAPLKYFRISSRYSKKRFHPVQKVFKAHLGTDYAAPAGTPILAVGDGKVTEAKFSKFNGNYVKIKHNSIYTTQYLHMSKIAKGIKPGKTVKKGQVIGYVGSTGLATGPHVCFRFWKNGKQVDGTKVKVTQEAEPIAKKDLPDFNALKDELMKELEKINIEQQKELAYN
ncbi:MAG TPA: peptidoglycan DD-metalloendopeptidase family protein, partial [Cytophagaceae bacterium]